jgi:hypothetical protein
MTVGRLDSKGNLIYMGAIQRADKEAWFKASCPAGRYFCSVYTPWSSFVNEITLATYGPQLINLQSVSESSMPKDYYQNLVKDKALKDETGWKDYNAQSQPKIRYKFEHGGDGFGFFFFENNSESTEFNCTLEFTQTKNLCALPPYTFSKPCLMVPPMSSESFVYFMVDTPSAIAFRMTTSFKKNATSLKLMIRKEGQKFERKFEGKSVGIMLYGLGHSEGVTWEYVNSSTGYVLEETVRFNLTNAWIEGYSGSELKIVLHPGQSKLVDVKFGNGSKPDSGSMDEAKFRIRKV